jgi:hypothetical protein
MPIKVSAAQKEMVMTKMMASTDGRRRIAASIQQPLRELRDYTSIGRKAFMMDELPDGALPIYDKDVDTPAFVVAEEGDSIQKVIKAERVLVTLYELASLPKIPFTQVKERRFDIIGRVKKKVKDELFRKEDQIIFKLFSEAADANDKNVPIVETSAGFSIETIIDAMSQVEKNAIRVDKIFMNPQTYKVLRKAGRDYLDFETQRQLLRTGLMGTVYGSEIYMSMEVPEDRVYMTAEPEYFGVFPVRIDLTVLPADNPTERCFGWSVFQQTGQLIHNSYGIQGIQIT